ncbi:MAG TPA: hypothetical protein PKC84_11800, partial [Paracoccaceae bacterium]|nr:hypothetical protein [Paracoccaceae bacterium]
TPKAIAAPSGPAEFTATLVPGGRVGRPARPPDAVLLDAPCSATGTIRRHPDLPFLRRPEDLPPLVGLQSALIDRALAMLAPGGRLVFCTCSLLPEEGEGQLDAALARHPGLTVEPPIPAPLPGWDPGWTTPAGGRPPRPPPWGARGGTACSWGWGLPPRG